MAGALPVISAISTAFSVVSEIQGASAQVKAVAQAGRDQQAIANYQAEVALEEGKAAQYRAEYDAKQYEEQAGQERASSQRGAAEQRRRARIAQSNAIARGAAGGGGAEDVYSTLAALGVEGDYAAGLELYEGDAASSTLNRQAGLSRYEGREAVRASKVGADSYRVTGQMNYNSAQSEAATIKRSGYTKAGSALSSFAGSSSANSLMAKYAPRGETWANGDAFRTR